MRPVLALSLLTLFGLFAEAAPVKFEVLNSEGEPLSNISIEASQNNEAYKLLGQTNSDGLFSADLAEGDWDFKASKNKSFQIVHSSAPGKVSFKTANFQVRIVNSFGKNQSDVEVFYNDEGEHFQSIGTTGQNGRVKTELFPGTYRFKAVKDHSNAVGTQTVSACANGGTLILQTAFYGIHVEKADGAGLSNVKVMAKMGPGKEVNLGNTDENGKFDIELFAGVYPFEVSVNGSSTKEVLALFGGGTSKSWVLKTEFDKQSGLEGFFGGFESNSFYGRGEAFKLGDEEIEQYSVDIMHFTAVQTAQGAYELQWISREEIGLDYYTLEVSEDGKIFVPLAERRSSGNSIRIQSYSANHFQIEPGPAYFRIKQTFKNGDIRYSKVIAINTDTDAPYLAYPNPTQGHLFIELPMVQDATVIVYDVNGAFVAEHKFSAIQHEMDLSSFAKGLYFIHINSKGKTEIHKITKY
ncbi:T9SS type A sorting domain-containing protein [bacterium]|nr:T9SS type A sorting domain-containing protein [bacterium]